MTFWDFVLNNYAMLYELIGLLVITWISAYLPQRIKVYGSITCLLLFLSVLAYNLELYFQTLPSQIVWRSILTATKYTLYPLVMMTILPATAIKKFSNRKIYLLLLIPEIISIPFYYTSQWTRIICYFVVNEVNGTPTSCWMVGPLRYWPYVIFALYLGLFVVQNFFYFKSSTKRNRFIPLFICLMAVMVVIAVLITGADVDYSPIFTSAYLLYFIFLYVYMASIDTLTGLMNRQCYYHDIRTYKDKVTYVISIDMNELKYINDAYGHDAGDQALEKVASIIKDNAGPSNIYRVGGDEFVVFYYKQYQDNDLEEIINNINNALAHTSYSCAFGYCKKKDGESLEETIKEADRKMYINKREVKEKIKARGGKIYSREETPSINEESKQED
ncbi:MAG: diguanylate cyclase [Acholeplasmatales bacterium]|nr:diguanylate cyclase [Acholeplasmatales bacterium]